jgi:hypothetical protein
LFLAGVGVCAALAGDAAREPGALDGPGVLLAPAVALVLIGYVVVVLMTRRAPSAARARGATFGVAAGVLWLVEIAAGGPILLPKALEQALGGSFALAAVVTTLAAGVWAARDAGDAALVTGLLAGLISGLVVFIGGIGMTLLLMERLGSRADYQRQLAQSGLPGMRAFLVQDALTGYGAHLLINPALGLLGGLLGWLTVRGIARVPSAGADG